MIVNIAALVLVIGITFVNSLFGLYSGIINVLCVIAALAVAFGFTEPLNAALVDAGLHPNYTEPATLVLLFVITALVLRTAADMLLRGNVRVPMYVDWVGGGICGFIIAQICVGVMVLGFLLLPWGDHVAMFWRYQRNVERGLDSTTNRAVFERTNLWLRSDEFTLWIVDRLSSGSLKAKTEFASVYPDYAEWVYWSGNTVQHESQTAPGRKDGDGFMEGLRVQIWWMPAGSTPLADVRYRERPATEDNPSPNFTSRAYRVGDGRKLIGARLILTKYSADAEKGRTAYHRFRPSMVRIVGTASGEPFHAVGTIFTPVTEALEQAYRMMEIDENISLVATGDVPIDVFFEVPADFEPSFVEYRRHARAALTEQNFSEFPPATRLTFAGGEVGDAATGGRGAARFVDAVDRMFTGERKELPFTLLRTKLGLNVDVQGGQFVSGRVAGDKSEYEAAGGAIGGNITEFRVPDDKRMLQLRVSVRQAKSLPGQIMNFVGSVTNQYRVEDSRGQTYPLVGYFAEIERSGQRYFEIVYLPEDPSFRGMLDFQDSSVRRALQEQDDAILGLIFLLEPGATPTRLATGGPGSFPLDALSIQMTR